jgi:hypothetical protein
MKISKAIGKGIFNTITLTVGAAAGFSVGALQVIAEEALSAFIENIF